MFSIDTCKFAAAASFACGVLLLLAGCAQTQVRDNPAYANANRCFQAAIFATEAMPHPDESTEVCDTALGIASLSRRDRAATLTNRGILQLERSAFGVAKDDFDQAIKLAPDLGAPYVNRGAALVGLHRYDEAIEDFSHGIDLKSEQIEKAYYNRAMAREQLNDIKGAYYDYQKAAELRPDWDPPKRQLRRFKLVRRPAYV